MDIKKTGFYNHQYWSISKKNSKRKYFFDFIL